MHGRKGTLSPLPPLLQDLSSQAAGHTVHTQHSQMIQAFGHTDPALYSELTTFTDRTVKHPQTGNAPCDGNCNLGSWRKNGKGDKHVKSYKQK